MSRTSPTQKLDILGNIALNPDRGVGELTESFKQEQLFVKPPNWDSAGDSIELLAFRNDVEHSNMLKLQKLFREHGDRQKIINSNRIEETTQVQKHLRHLFIEANNFFKECADKRTNAEVKVQEEKQLHATLKQTIQDFKTKIDVLSEFRKQLKNTVKQFEPYEQVINDAVARNDNWTSIKDCMARCDALMMTQVEINIMKSKKLDDILELRSKMVKLTTEAALTVLGLNNELAELERAHNAAMTACLKWEKIIFEVKNCLIENNLVKARMMDEISLMYRRLSRRKGIFTSQKNVGKELDFVRDEIRIFKEVLKECTASKK